MQQPSIIKANIRKLKMPESLSLKSKVSLQLTEFINQAASSYHKYTNQALLENSSNLITDLYNADFVFAAHKYFPDEPKFVFGNAKALELWELDWDSFIGMPSRLTAQEVHQEERERLLREVQLNGYIKNYTGIRISSTGRRFQINNAIVWNVTDSSGEAIGQAVKFSEFEYL